MAFIGSICQPLRKFFATHAKLLAGRQIYVGCSGNFTIEAILSSVCPSAELYSNDVSLYSTAVGFMLTDRRLPLEIVHPELLWLNDYAARGSAEQVAVLMLLVDALGFEKRNNRFKQRMWQAYVDQFPALFAATLAKVQRFRDAVRIRDYTTTDVYDFFPRPGAAEHDLEDVAKPTADDYNRGRLYSVIVPGCHDDLQRMISRWLQDVTF